ncbi:MAG: hypothetical protein JNM18_22890 [Planctomycetaceae bacterium]|nr:hypothetical protein [Planctomycetaceae bacterium]
MRTLNRLWNEQDGAIVSAEIMLVGTLLVIGVIVGLKSVRDSVVTELADIAQALDNTSQSYWYGGSQNAYGGTSAASYSDNAYQNGTSAKCIDTASSAMGQG